ncbi:MAG: MFS transporter [Oscillospiraceae bacterium]
MKLNNRQTIYVGFAFMSICAFWQVYDGLVPLILKETFHVNDAISGFIMALDNVLALFMLPLFGAFSDRVKTRWGRRMPFIFCGTVFAAVVSLLLPLANRMQSLSLFIVGLALTLIIMATYRSPAVALMPDVTIKPLRSRANAIINLMGAMGGIIMLAVIGIGVPKTASPDYMPAFLINSIFMLICLMILVKTTNETRLTARMRKDSSAIGDTEEENGSSGEAMSPEVKRSLYLILASVFLWFMGYNAITTSFSKYANVYWGLEGGLYAYTLMVAQAAAILSYIPVGFIAGWIGRRKAILGGVVLLALAFGASMIFQRFSAMIFFYFILAGVGWAAINVNSYPMVVEMSRGANIGKYTGYYYTASQAAQIITPILSGAVLEYGYLFLGDSNPDAGYVLLFPYGAIFVALSFVTMLFVRHGDAKAQRKSSVLENFDVDD